MAGEREYLDLILQAIRVCANFKPKFGRGGKEGLTLPTFELVYGEDAFYSWFGLNSPLIYAAHRAGGGITSLYRQIGIGCQWALTHIIRDRFSLSEADARWIFPLTTAGGAAKDLALDARIPLQALAPERSPIMERWLEAATAVLSKPRDAARNGVVFEIRQGYKSADSKRQNADVDNASHAYAYGYLPVVLLLSAQINTAVAKRYERGRMVALERKHDRHITCEYLCLFPGGDWLRLSRILCPEFSGDQSGSGPGDGEITWPSRIERVSPSHSSLIWGGHLPPQVAESI
ncbi:MAG: hypothetical protein IVW57_10900 [Ktedonobacterales bacterium]|nr:hypothetical protein [Ktedonobacterales bacterium]